MSISGDHNAYFKPGVHAMKSNLLIVMDMRMEKIYGAKIV